MINIKKIRKREFIRFNKKVNRIINTNKNQNHPLNGWFEKAL